MIDICHITALAVQALRVAVPCLLVSMVVSPTGVQSMLNMIPDVITTGLSVAGGFIVVVGYAMVLNMMGAKYLMPFFFLGFVIAAFTDFNLVAFGIMGIVFGLIYIQLNPKFNMPKAVPAAAAPAGGASMDADLDDDLDDELE